MGWIYKLEEIMMFPRRTSKEEREGRKEGKKTGGGFIHHYPARSGLGLNGF